MWSRRKTPLEKKPPSLIEDGGRDEPSHGIQAFDSRRITQYESELITSPPLGVAKAYQTGMLTVDLMNFTEPSMERVLTPPGWSELALIKVMVARLS